MIITENEKQGILSLYYENYSTVMDDIVIFEWLSPDEKYCIFLDDVYDIDNKTRIGNIWENFDNFKMFLKHCFTVSKTISENIRISALESIDSLVLSESNNNMIHMKTYIKNMLCEEDGGIMNWITNKAKQWGTDAVTGVTSFVQTGIKGSKEIISKVSNSEWSQVFELIKKGALYVARRLRSAMYHPVGLILDAILIATGIGTVAVKYAWGIIVALDIYELFGGEKENPNLGFGWRILFLCIDLLGFLTAGAAAKSARTTLEVAAKGAKTDAELIANLSKSPVAKGFFEKIGKMLDNLPAVLNETKTFLSKKFPKGAEFVSGVISKVTNVVNLIRNFIFKITRPAKVGQSISSRVASGVKAGTKTTGVIMGLDAAIEKGKDIYNKYQEDQVLTAYSNNQVTSDYSGLNY